MHGWENTKSDKGVNEPTDFLWYVNPIKYINKTELKNAIMTVSYVRGV